MKRAAHTGPRGDAEACTRKSLVKVVEEIAVARGIAIPAHADDARKGLMRTGGEETIRAGLDPPTLGQSLKSPHLLRWVFGPGDELPETVRRDFDDFAKLRVS